MIKKSQWDKNQRCSKAVFLSGGCTGEDLSLPFLASRAWLRLGSWTLPPALKSAMPVFALPISLVLMSSVSCFHI